jgi:O-antigen ligase
VIERRSDWPLLAAATAVMLLVAAAAAALELGGGGDAPSVYEQSVGVLVGLGVVVLSLASRPAWPLSIGLALTAFSSHWGDMNIPVALDRLVLYSAIVSTLVREARSGSSRLRTEPIHWLLGVAVVYAICSTLIAGTLDDDAARFALLDRFSIVAFALFFVAPIAFRDERDRQVLLGVLVTLGAYLGLTAVLETTGPRGLLFPRYIDDPSVGIHFDRARGPFTESVGNGLVLYACGIAAAIAAFTWTDRRLRGIAGLVTLLCALGTLLTLTRAIWLGAVVGSILVLLAARETRRWVVPAIALGAAMVLIAFAAIPGLEGRAEARSDDDRPLWDRRNSNAAAIRMLAERPTVGWGWGRYRTESLEFYRQADDYPLTGVLDVHNVFLANAVELGVLGAALWAAALLAAVLGGVLRRGPPELRPWRIGLVGVAACYLVAANTTPLSFTMPTLLLWTWAGLARGQRETG